MSARMSTHEAASGTLQVYLLGVVDWDLVLRLQRRLHYDVTGDRSQACVILCEHPPIITVGRHGSRSHIRLESEELQLRGWRIRWVNRGGGCWLHSPGQIGVYPILPLDRLNLTIPAYLACLGNAMARVFDDFSIHHAVHADDAGVWIGRRLAATLGVSVRDWVSLYGGCLNLHPDLDLYRDITSHPRALEPMTSLERERRGPVRPSLVRERLLDHLRAAFGFADVTIFTDHPLLHETPKPAIPTAQSGPMMPV